MRPFATLIVLVAIAATAALAQVAPPASKPATRPTTYLYSAATTRFRPLSFA